MSRFRFFRQSAWMLASTAGGGIFGWALQAALNGALLKSHSELGTYETLIAGVAQIGIPLGFLQTAFAQLGARSVHAEHQAELSGAIRGYLRGMVMFWIVLSVGLLLFQSRLTGLFHIESLELWLAFAAAFFSLTTPGLFGVLQGRQNFRWLGVAQVFNQFALFAAIGASVTFIRPTATAALSGYLIAVACGFAFALFLTRADWKLTPRPFDILAFIRRFLPLTLGIGSLTYLSTQDMITAQQFLSGDPSIDAYALARKPARVLFFLSAPLVMVLFPTVIRSVARSEKTSALAQALAATTLIGLGAALACTLFPMIPLRILAPTVGAETLAAAALLLRPLSWAFVPLALSNALVSNLLAREQVRAVYWLVAVAVACGITLRLRHPSLPAVAWTFAFYNTLFFLVAAFFTWRASTSSRAADPAE